MNEMRKLMEIVSFSDRPATQIYTWFERDRAHVELRNDETDETIIEWWDDDLQQAVEDGFLDPKDWWGSAQDHAERMGLI